MRTPSQPPQKPLWIRILGALFYLFFCAIVVVASTAAGYLASGPLGAGAVITVLRNPDPAEAFDGRSTVNILILGCDEDRTRGGKKVTRSQARSDMILLTRIDFKNRFITGISIPRDLEVDLPGYAPQKINAFHSIGGPELAKTAVESVLGVEVDKVVALDYEAFQDMVDVVGGIEINVQKRMKWSDRAGDLYIDLEPGLQHLDGNKAMGYVRFRHSDSDFVRQQRQKDFLLAFKDAVLKDPLKLNAVTEKAMDTLGGALTTDEVLAIALFSQGVSGERINMGMVPVLPGSGTNLRVDNEKLPQVLHELHFDGSSPIATIP